MRLPALDEPTLARAARALGSVLRCGDVLTLDGPMGAGKTTFTRAMAHGLGVFRPQRVRSPTFNLCLMHDGPRPLAHLDLFRLSQQDPHGSAPLAEAAFEALGLEELIDHGHATDAVVVVEWSSLWSDPPADRLAITLELRAATPDQRWLAVEAHGPNARVRAAAWAEALPDLHG